MTISLIFDIAIAAILLLCLIVGGVRGFISSLLSVAVFAAALLGSAILANALADPVSDWLTPRVEQYVLDRLTNGHGDEAVSAAAASDNEALAGLVSEEELNAEYIMPYAFDERICPAVAKAVAEAARKSGVARI